MGWVKQKLAKSNESVKGLIVSQSVDDALWYSISSLPDIAVQFYKVDFHLHDAHPPNGARPR
jgi:hypothetical protein